jgi:preprotein translocase subunit SecA
MEDGPEPLIEGGVDENFLCPGMPERCPRCRSQRPQVAASDKNVSPSRVHGKSLGATAEEITRVSLTGDCAPAPLHVQRQITSLVWAALRQQDYASGTDCRVKVREDGDTYKVRAMAQEPGGFPLRLLEVRFPKKGMPDEEYGDLVAKFELTDFMHPDDDTLCVGGAPGSDAPDTVQVGRTEVPRAGRNAPCPCGSGKKYKKCCLQ